MSPVPIGWEAGWAPEPVWMTWRSEKSWPYRDSNSDPLVLQPVPSYYTDYAIQTSGITQCSPLKVNHLFVGTCRLHLQYWIVSQARNRIKQAASKFMLVSCLAYSLTLKMEATRSSKTFIDFQRPTRCYIQDNRILYIILFCTVSDISRYLKSRLFHRIMYNYTLLLDIWRPSNTWKCVKEENWRN
jgi:hypothetical protein